MTAYYNEINPYAAQWLRNLIDAGHIAPGLVDERSIEDVTPNDLAGFTQCHFFAGIGVWSYSLRLAGWSDNREVWTGSCPCQPFSTAGKSAGFDDERHLWPSWYWLIDRCKPENIFGEQVASKDGLGWLDLVQSDLENSGYSSEAIDLCAAGVGSPNIRQRLWFTAERLANPYGSNSQQLERERTMPFQTESARPRDKFNGRSDISGLADSSSESSQWDTRSIPGEKEKISGEREFNGDISDGHPNGSENSIMADAELQQRQESETGDNEASRRDKKSAEAARFCESLRMANTNSDGLEEKRGRLSSSKCDGVTGDSALSKAQPMSGPVNGFWKNSDWLLCRDERWRAVRPGSFPLVNGSPSRVGRLSAYGNAINAQAAKIFIESVMECKPE